ncbi:MAG TPA: hypothetical protein VHO47_05035 [Candidatus Babeliales bacterium]|nr:hypothetical protein [Candidatus Babeliales bacterium]
MNPLSLVTLFFFVFSRSVFSMESSNTPPADSSDFNEIKTRILLTPKDQLSANRLTRAALENNEPYGHESRQALIEKTAAKEPFFLIDECSGHGHAPCPFDRFTNKILRNEYSKTVSLALLAKIKTAKGTVKYATFGNRGRFSDLEILVHTLEKKPKASIAIDVINIGYELGCLKKESPIVSLFETTEQNCQLINGLKKMFPDANLRLSSFSGVEHYLSDAETNDEFIVPDIFCAADIEYQPMSSGPKNALLAFHELSVRTLLANQKAESILLSEKCNGMIQTMTRKPGEPFYYEVSCKKPSTKSKTKHRGKHRKN